jgi:Na+/proline symporter
VAGKIDEGWAFLKVVRDSMRSALHDESIPVFVFAPLLWGLAISNNSTTHQNNVISTIHEISSTFGTSLDSNSILPPLLQNIVGMLCVMSVMLTTESHEKSILF